MARQPHGPGPRDLADAAVAGTAVADEESVSHSVQQGAEDALGRFPREGLARVCLLDLDEGAAGMFVCRR